MKIKKCKICGKSFSNRGNSSLTCSYECSLENKRINHRRNSKLWILRHPKKRKEITHNYSMKNKEILSIKASEWRKKNPQKVIEQTRKWRKNNPKKRNAQARAQNNIKIPKGQLCEICNKKKAVHRHHSNYSKPLEVIFLCIKCHVNLHLNKKISK